MTLETPARREPRGAARDSGQTGDAESPSGGDLALAIRSIRKDCEDVVRGEGREIGYDLLDGHTRRQIGQHIVHGDSQSADDRFAPALARLDGDDASIVHGAATVGLARRTVNDAHSPTLGVLGQPALIYPNGYTTAEPTTREGLLRRRQDRESDASGQVAGTSRL